MTKKLKKNPKKLMEKLKTQGFVSNAFICFQAELYKVKEVQFKFN